MRGLTSIVTSIMLVLITVTLAGLTWGFLQGIFSPVTSKALSLADASCSNNVAKIVLRNAGTSTITISSTLMQTEPYVSDANTVLLMHFDDPGPTAADSSGYGNTGKLTGMDTVTSWVDGKFGKALTFDNSSGQEQVNVSDSILLNGLNNWTVEGWIKTTQQGSNPSRPPLLQKYDTKMGQSRGYFLGINTTLGNASFFIANNLNAKTATSRLGGFNDGQWHHFAGVVRGATIEIYVDGVLLGSVSGADLGVNTVNLTIGGLPGSPDLLGTIDEVRVSRTWRDFSNKQQGWNYICNGSGNQYLCGDLSVVKLNGPGVFTPSFDKSAVDPQEVFMFKDGDCRGRCAYRIISPSIGVEVAADC